MTPASERLSAGVRTRRRAASVRAIPIAVLVLVAFGTVPEAWSQRLLFHSGFEADVQVKQHPWLPDLIGADRSVAPPNDWEADLERDGRQFFFNFCNYVTPEDMGVEITADPAGGPNRALRMYQRNVFPANQSTNKTRVQAELRISDPDALREFYQECRLYIHPDIRKLENYPEKRSEGPQLMELDCADAGCGRFRIVVVFRLQGPGKPLQWRAWCHTLCTPRETFWDLTSDAPVPYGEWVSLRMHWKSNAGREQDGRFRYAYQADGQSERVIADVRGQWVTWPQTSTWGIRAWKPFVWYNAGESETHYIRDNGGLAQIYVDDFRLWDSPPATVGVMRPAADGDGHRGACAARAACGVDLAGRVMRGREGATCGAAFRDDAFLFPNAATGLRGVSTLSGAGQQ